MLTQVEHAHPVERAGVIGSEGDGSVGHGTIQNRGGLRDDEQGQHGKQQRRPASHAAE